ncbi:MAG: galactose-1-phosphate uridylyltransferase [Deltaproteobacteria bacterium]|nr:galactose-1-phosphate uridylyltransferase [Deltaproteobacteria bacterium]
MPELRKDPIIGRWVIIATERGKRPSDFVSEKKESSDRFCALCPGNEAKTPPEVYALRPEGSPPNTPGWRLRVVKNKFPALIAEERLEQTSTGVFEWMSGVGDHEVVIETPQHNTRLFDLDVEAVADVIWAYRERIHALKQDTRFRFVMVFKNHGVAAGASLEHSHSQLVALPIVPKRVFEEMEGAQRYHAEHHRCIFCDIIKQEVDAEVRIIEQKDGVIAVAPFASRFPFETWIIPEKHSPSFEEMEDYHELAQVLRGVLRRMDRILNDPPFNLVIHTSPFGETTHAYYHWHMEIMPRVTKVAGFEWGTGFYINPTPPEEAAQYLREVSP